MARSLIEQESKTAANIKNKNVGKAVSEALRSIGYKLKILTSIPVNGLVICCGKFVCQNITTSMPSSEISNNYL